jgi:type II secretory ATPase GspE/PulE/Tfp pilus assembly ATPase PilB-like protein
VPVIELVKSDTALRNAVTTLDLRQIEAAAHRQAQHETLMETGVRLAAEGKTTIDDVYRLLHSENSDSEDHDPSSSAVAPGQHS